MLFIPKHQQQDFIKWIWKNQKSETKPVYCLRRFIRILIALASDIRHGQINLRAMSLVYTTLLSLVPLLAISFSVLKGFGVHNQIEPLLLSVLEPLGDKKFEIIENIIGFVDNIQVGILGSVGLGFLLYSVLSLLQKIERSFNDIWGIVQARKLAARFSDYLSVLLVGPVLIIISIGMTTSARNADIIEKITGTSLINGLFSKIDIVLPFIIMTAAFTFIYAFIPNTKVRLVPAIIGGTTATALWKTLGVLFAIFVSGANNYTVIYSTFATLLFFMIWLYLAWLIVLIGASISYYIQNPSNQIMAGKHLIMSPRMREWAAVAMCSLIAKNFYSQKAALTIENLSKSLQVPTKSANVILSALEEQNIVKQTQETPPSFLPGRPFEETSVWDVLQAVRIHGEKSGIDMDFLKKHSTVQQVFNEYEAENKENLSKKNLKDLGISPIKN